MQVAEFPNKDFTKHMAEVLRKAKEAAAEFKTGLVGSEHILLAFLRVEDCEANLALSAAGETLEQQKRIREKYFEVFKRSVTRSSTMSGFSPRTKAMVDRAQALSAEDSAGTHGKPCIGTEHMLLAILSIPNCIGVRMLEERMGIDPDRLRRCAQERIVPPSLAEEDKEEESEPSRKGPYYEAMKRSFSESDRLYRRPKGSGPDSELMKYGVDLTRKALEGRLDPVIGRRDEIEKVIQILSRRTKNNPVLIGEPGVGKSAVVEGLAQAIVSGDVPDLLRDKCVFSLNLTGLLAGAKYRGEFEERLKNVIGASSESPMDASNILKPMLARGELQTIGATTVEEYRKFIEKDAALERRFTPVMVEQPSVEDTITILEGLKGKYEAHHNVIITREAIEEAARLSDRYITDRFLPDKAIDLIDEAASRKRLVSLNGPAEMHELEDRLERISLENKRAVGRGDTERSERLMREGEELAKKIRAMKAEQSDRITLTHLSIGKEEIAEIVSSWTGVPVVKLTETESKRLIHMEEELHDRIIGQDEAVSAISRAIRRARAGLKDPNRPVGSFIFVGPTGVGKTDLCKALAESLFGDERLMIRLDMSEYMEKHSVSKLIGAPPGYVGFDDSQGTLTERVRTKPYSVVLFDEIEKAHPDVFHILLQILDDGRLSDSRGRVVSFKNCVLILTSNIGAHEVKEVGKLGFSAQEEENAYEKVKENINEALKKHFRPEFLNRLDDVIIFHQLTREDASKICDKFLKTLKKKLSDRGIEIEISSRVRDKIVSEGYSEEFGARPLKRTVQKLLEDPLSEEILLGRFPPECKIYADLYNDKIVFTSK